jgi:hypothetical protein
MKPAVEYANHYTRRSLLRLSALGLLGGALVFACGDEEDPRMNPTSVPAAGGDNGAGATELKLISGWYRDRRVQYFDLGTNTKLTQGSSIAVAPIYALVSGVDAQGNPRPVQGQGNIIAVKPGDPGYSDLWQLNLVTVPEGYKANDIKSVAALRSSGFASAPTTMYVNCPVVPRGTTLEGGKPLVQGWLDGQEVFYPDFGLNQPVAIPIWAFATGMDNRGQPMLVPGQNNVIDALPAEPGYSAFWRLNVVMVPQSYQVNSIRSAQAVRDSGLAVQQTDTVVNCPVV